ncbi:MAG TPA: type II toxin-antitoxin system RelE/ParE family toxin [Pyrinomonadaceae bacterium]|nr:type II toxin-antitoxin system RelE/ParE family toxin [Pyrinomonadaceae bacterium]
MALNYTILTLSAARRQLRQLQNAKKPETKNIIDVIKSLAQNPRPRGCRKLASRPEWRTRIGSYRVLYLIDDLRRTVTVVVVAHRRDVYR